MSASQMRYLMISGKKSDIEFQGQQINQQRTTLATQSSTYNSQLLNLNVPTPPSSEDFTRVSYAYNSNGQNYDMKGVSYRTTPYTDDDGNPYPANTYIVNYSYDTTAPAGKANGYVAAQQNGAGYAITLNGTLNVLSLVDFGTSGSQTQEQMADESNIGYLQRDVADLATETTFYKYASGDATKYLSATQLAAVTAGGTTGNASTYVVDDNAKTTIPGKLYGCPKVEYSESGRLQSFTDSTGKDYDLTVGTEYDEEAYSSAYNEYVFEKDSYEQAMHQINAKLEMVQAQDKKLELKLSDLDTQQSALSTEMDAVKKVIDKNVETSFKTFA